jgi:hypothetical protein
MTTHYEVVVDQGEGCLPRLKRLETWPFTGLHAFDSELDAIEQGEANDLGFGFIVERVVTERRVAYRHPPTR